MPDAAAYQVPIDGYAMQLRTPELMSVSAGMFADAPTERHLIALVEALRRVPPNDRAPTWELAVRYFGRRTELLRAAAEIGMDLVHGQDLIEAYTTSLSVVARLEPASPGAG